MSNCTKKIKTDDCIQTRDDGYNECDKWADEGSKQCSAWEKCKWYTPWNCIAGFFCKAYYWVANWVCKGYRWVENIVCVAWKYITKFVCVAIDLISTIINFIVTFIDVIVSIIGGIIGFIVAIISSIPYIGRFIEWVINIVKAIVYGIFSIPDSILTLLGIMPEKKLKLLVIIQKDNRGNPIVNNIEVVYRYVQYLINTFRIEMNIRVMPVNLLLFKTAFSDDNYSLSDFVKTDDGTSDYQTLDVCCDNCAVGADLSSNGSIFNLIMARLGFFTNGRRLIGYGAPIIAFSVRSYTDGKAGCSLGPLSDYVTIKFNETQNGKKADGTDYSISELTPEKPLDAVTDLAHEVGHCCNLPHFDSDNLMQRSPARTGKLTVWQKVLVRSSRHVTYF